MTTPEPVSSAPDTVALRQQVAEIASEHLHACPHCPKDKPEWVVDEGQVHEIVAQVVAEREAGLRADLDRARAELDERRVELAKAIYAATDLPWEPLLVEARHVTSQWLDRGAKLDELARVSGARPIPDDAAERPCPEKGVDPETRTVLDCELPAGHDGSHQQGDGFWRKGAPAHVLADLGATPTTDPVQRLTLAELHAVLHANLLAECGCTGGPDCAARFHGHGCALDPCGEALTTPTTGPAPAAADPTAPYRHLLGAIWLYVDWRYLTKQMTTEQKELWADAVDAFGEPQEGKAERWWREPAAPQAPAEPKKQCSWWWDTKQCPDWALPGGQRCGVHQREYDAMARTNSATLAAREDAATPDDETVTLDDLSGPECGKTGRTSDVGCDGTCEACTPDDDYGDDIRPSGPLAPIRHEEE